MEVVRRITDDDVEHVLDDSGSVKLIWRIRNFSKLTEEKIYSRVFLAGGCQWRLLVFPNCSDLSIYLDVADSCSLPQGWSRNAKFTLAVVNQFNTEFTVRKDEQHLFNENKRQSGFESLIPLSKLDDPELLYLMNDTLIVEAGVIVDSVVHYSMHDVEKDSSRIEPESPHGLTDASAGLEEDAEGIVQTATLTSYDEVVIKASTPSSEASSVGTAASFDDIQSSLLVQMMSRSLLTELSFRTKGEISDPNQEAAELNFRQKQKKALECFLNMSLEAIKEADAFNDIEEILLELVQHYENLHEKTILEDFISRFNEFKKIIPIATTVAEDAHARKTYLSRKTADLDERFVQKKNEISSLVAEYSRFSEEEEKVEAEIELLINKKMQFLSHMKSIAAQLEKTNQETYKELEEWQNLQDEMKQANAEWVGAKEKLALANIHWKLLKENLGVGKHKVL